MEGVVLLPADGGGEPDPGEGLRQLDRLLRRRRPPRGRRRAGAPPRALVDAQGGQEQRRSRQSETRLGRDGGTIKRLTRNFTKKTTLFIIPRADRKSQVRQYLGFCSADSKANEDKK